MKQKLLAAHRMGITTVLIPQRNEPDLDDMPSEVLEKLEVDPVSDVREVLALALESAEVHATARRPEKENRIATKRGGRSYGSAAVGVYAANSSKGAALLR